MKQMTTLSLMFPIIRLYRDDGLAIVRGTNGPELDKSRKQIIQLFKNKGLSITIITLDLVNGKYYPYRKPNDGSSYINANSNHPPSIIKQLPTMINNRLSDLSYDKKDFDKVKDV